MNFSIVFCFAGLALWCGQTIYKVTEISIQNGCLPTWAQLKASQLNERVRRNSRALLIGAAFFFLFGIAAWKITNNVPDVHMNAWQAGYVIAKMFLLLLIYINVSMRLLIYRFAGGQPSKTLPLSTEIMASLRMTGLFPDTDDLPSVLVRLTNALIIIDVLFIVFQFFII